MAPRRHPLQDAQQTYCYHCGTTRWLVPLTTADGERWYCAVCLAPVGTPRPGEG